MTFFSRLYSCVSPKLRRKSLFFADGTQDTVTEQVNCFQTFGIQLVFAFSIIMIIIFGILYYSRNVLSTTLASSLIILLEGLGLYALWKKLSNDISIHKKEDTSQTRNSQ